MINAEALEVRFRDASYLQMTEKKDFGRDWLKQTPVSHFIHVPKSYTEKAHDVQSHEIGTCLSTENFSK